MSNLVKITDHEQRALDRLISQFKGKINIENVIKIFTPQIQELENMFFDLLEKRYLSIAEGAQLDEIGEILNQGRNGLNDDDYRVILYNKIAEYNSEGTAEDIIGIFKIVSGSEKVVLEDLGIAGFAITGINANPIIVESSIIDSVKNAKIAGVKVRYIVLTDDDTFGFQGSADSEGFGVGKFARLIYNPPVFAFSGGNTEFAGGFGVGGFLT